VFFFVLACSRMIGAKREMLRHEKNVKRSVTPEGNKRPKSFIILLTPRTHYATKKCQLSRSSNQEKLTLSTSVPEVVLLSRFWRSLQCYKRELLSFLRQLRTPSLVLEFRHELLHLVANFLRTPARRNWCSTVLLRPPDIVHYDHFRFSFYELFLDFECSFF